MKIVVLIATAILTYKFWEDTKLLEKFSDYLQNMKRKQ